MVQKDDPLWGVADASDNTSAEPRIDRGELIDKIEAHGVRLGWSRAGACPCRDATKGATRRPDPLCALCRGTAVFYFGPKGYVPPDTIGKPLDAIQKRLLARDDGAVIRGIIGKAFNEQDLYDQFGNWSWGDTLVSVRPENQLGYFDRLVNLDAESVFSEAIDQPALLANGRPAPLILRYPAIRVFGVRTLTERLDGRFDVVAGDVLWDPRRAPAAKTRMSVTYAMHPVWVVDEFPNLIRASQDADGNPVNLPVRAKVKLDFLPNPEDKDR